MVEDSQLIEEKKQRDKQEHAKRVLREVQQANEMSKIMKQENILKEREEEEKLKRYNQDKTMKEMERIENEKRIKEEKEREIKRLRDL